MPERPFVCQPTFYNRCPVINRAISWEAEYLFCRIIRETSQEWRFEVDPENIAHSVRCRALEPERRQAAWTVAKVAKHLSELLSAGIVRRAVHDGRCWLEIGEAWRYVKGRDASAPPGPPQQSEMALGPVLLAVPETPAAAPPNPFRGVKKKSKANESRARDAGQGSDAGTRALSSSGDSSGRFAKDEDDSSDEVWKDLCSVMPPSEMIANGSAWLRRISTARRAVALTVEDLKAMTPDQRRELRNLPAFAMHRFTLHNAAA